MFCDACRSADNRQICHIGGLMLHEVALSSILHIVSWSLHKAHRPVRSTAPTETIVVGGCIDIEKSIAHGYSKFLQIPVKLVIAVDSKDLNNSLNVQQQSADRSTRGSIGVISFKFEAQNVNEIIWIADKVSTTDVGTESDSQLEAAVAQMLLTGLLLFVI